jgi:hypothetical protein
MDRTALITALILLAVLTLLTPEGRADEYLLRWIPPPESFAPEPFVAGYKVYLAPECSYPRTQVDIGFQSPDLNGVALWPLALPDDGYDYYVMMTAYNMDGNESAFSNLICVRVTGEGPESCDPRPDCRTPESPTDILLDLWYLQSFLDETARTLRGEADAGLMKELDKLEEAIDKARVWLDGDEDSIHKALKAFGRVIHKLGSLTKGGGDPGEVSAAEDAALHVLRTIAQREVWSVACVGDARCMRRVAKLQEKVWKGDAKRARGRKATAASSYVSACRGAGKL